MESLLRKLATYLKLKTISKEDFLDKKVVVIFGGSGNFKGIILKQEYEDVIFINISRKKEIEGDSFYNLSYDLLKDTPDKVLKNIINSFGKIDSVIYASVSTTFKTIDLLKDDELNKEFFFSVTYPMKILQFLEKYWKDKSDLDKKFIAISSGSSFGPNLKRLDRASYSIGKASLNMLCNYYYYNLKLVEGKLFVLCPGKFKEKHVKEMLSFRIKEIIESKSKEIQEFALEKIY